MHTVKFDANGNQIWYAPYTTAYFDNYEPGEMRWDGQSNIYVASAMSGPTGRLVLLRYDISMSVKDPIPFGHMNAAPNPMTTSTTVDLSNWTGTVTCSVADAFGRTIRLTKAQGPGPMVIDRDGLAAGLYVLTFVSTERSAQLKLVIE
ncbi:MAG: T9SS type A sorting domain-containing protein [Flavobacteriales bacterium]|nr:T9SS type A sorting domain-containing protein [Flavobacteriales bacterium]